MKKNIVFVIPSLIAGGAEKSLVNLLNTIDYSIYNVDLVLFHKHGTFLTMIPNEVQIVALNENYKIFTKSLFKSSLDYIKKLRFDLLLNRVLFSLKNKTITNKAIAEQKSWKNIQSSISVLDKKYDAAIGFLEKSSIYFIVDKVKAVKKIGWIHTNYSNSGMNADFDNSYFQRLDALIGVSPECSDDLKKHFPSILNKIKVIYNIVSSATINALASKDCKECSSFKSKNVLITIARLSFEKGCDLAIEASRILKLNNVDFQWVIIGDGNERISLENKIKENQLENEFKLIGLRENPYPYIKACKIYIQPSRYEGKSMAIEEAKILHKPIIITNYATAKDQINPNQTGLIAEMTAQSLANKIQNLIENVDLQKQLILNLSNEQFGTETEINKLYELING